MVLGYQGEGRFMMLFESVTELVEAVFAVVLTGVASQLLR
jgi:hypothetical protein